MKYMVVECHPAYAVVLAEDGRFLKAANLRYEVGQSVCDIIEMELPQLAPAVQTSRRWVPMLASMAACLVLMVSGWFLNFAPCASVYLSINPQVKIDVSRTDRVLSVTGVNADGAELLTGYTPRKQALNQVMDELVDRAIDMGYLHEGGVITLALDADDKWVDAHTQALNQELNNHLVDKITVTIDITPGSQIPEPTQPAPTAGRQTAAAGETDYGASDYGKTQSSQSDYDDNRDDDGGDSSYADSRYDGQTDYASQEGDSGSAGKESGYDAAEKESGYDAPEKESGYDDAEKESGYDAPRKESTSTSSKKDSGYSASDKDSDYSSSRKDSDYSSSRKDSDYGSSKKDSGYSSSKKGSDYGDSDHDD